MNTSLGPYVCFLKQSFVAATLLCEMPCKVVDIKETMKNNLGCIFCKGLFSTKLGKIKYSPVVLGLGRGMIFVMGLYLVEVLGKVNLIYLIPAGVEVRVREGQSVSHSLNWSLYWLSR